MFRSKKGFLSRIYSQDSLNLTNYLQIFSNPELDAHYFQSPVPGADPPDPPTISGSFSRVVAFQSILAQSCAIKSSFYI